VTIDGKVHVFDLHHDKYKALCVQVVPGPSSGQAVVSRSQARLTHISFNQTHPVIITGDNQGQVHCHKLSPNLRKQTKDVRMALLNKNMAKAAELEINKLEVLLAQVRDHQRRDSL